MDNLIARLRGWKKFGGIVKHRETFYGEATGREYSNVRYTPTTINDPTALMSEAASHIQSIEEENKRLRGQWEKLAEITGQAKVTDGPDRVYWDGAWHEGPLATAYIKTIRAVNKMAELSLSHTIVGEGSGQ